MSACSCLGDSPLENLRTYLQDKDFPDDAAFQNAFVAFNLYEKNYAMTILKALEQSLPHKEPADLARANIEHIMPKVLTSEWHHMVGVQDGPVHRRFLHTPGNLTITAYNGELGQKSFVDKRKIYKESHFELTKRLFFFNIAMWNAGEIEKRGKWMAERAKDIWIGPFA